MNYIKHFLVLTLLTGTLGLNATLEEEAPILDDPNMAHIICGIEKLLDEDSTVNSLATKYDEKIRNLDNHKKLQNNTTQAHPLDNPSIKVSYFCYIWVYTQHGPILALTSYFNLHQ
jgi:hypothetical protein